MGASAIHVEDMAGLMTPKAAYDLIRALKKELTVPIHLHAHCVGGLADMAYWEAIQAGVDGLDVCVSSMASARLILPLKAILLPYGERRVTPRLV